MLDSLYNPSKTVSEIQISNLINPEISGQKILCSLNLKGILYPVKFAIHHSLPIAIWMTIQEHQLTFIPQFINLLP
jgi:hypothetical protein